ncbi:MAG: hypothetical protein ACOC0N_12325 [Chroococcales cyanobacterium]
MIHHISIPAQNPHAVAQVLAEIVQGKVAPFPPHPGSYFVLALDSYGTAIEVYPHGTEMHPGQDNEQVIFKNNTLSSSAVAH